MEYEKATELHQTAWEGLRKRLGETHLETLTSLEDLAMSYLQPEGEHGDIEEQLSKATKDLDSLLNNGRRS